MEQAAVGYEHDIRPLFREKDISSMSRAFDLGSYEDVRANAEKILERVSDGSMPCDGAWRRIASSCSAAGSAPAVRPDAATPRFAFSRRRGFLVRARQGLPQLAA